MNIKRILKRSTIFLLAFALTICLATIQPSGSALAASKSYTVTANLYVPGDLNTQLPGVTAYITNGNNPLGLGGYDAVAPTTPVSDNASLTVEANGKMTLNVSIPNPVFTLQKIGGSSNAAITNSVRDSETYATADGSVSRTGRITKITVELKDRSGLYVFTDCIEFPTLLGEDWTVPLTLKVDLSGVNFGPEGEAAVETPNPTVSEQPAGGGETPSETPDRASSPKPSAELNYDKLNAAIGTVDKALASTVVSKDGSDVDTANVWVTPSAADTLRFALKNAKAALSAANQPKADKAAETLIAAYAKFASSRKSGTKLGRDEEAKNGRELAAGTYTVSANIWFNKADTGLPLNPHITNGTFPPYNPVKNNATLTVAEDGSALVTIPVIIQDKVMTVRSIAGLALTDAKTNKDGVITEITVDMGALSGSKTVVTRKATAEIQMGNLAMSISGLDKDHTWPATFELNLSGVRTKDGSTMPTVELAMMDASAVSSAMASASSEEQDDTEPGETPSQALINTQAEAQTETQPEADTPAAERNFTLLLALAAVALFVAAAAGWILIRKRTRNRNE